jgi:ankyrin repeat protein
MDLPLAEGEAKRGLHDDSAPEPRKRAKPEEAEDTVLKGQGPAGLEDAGQVQARTRAGGSACMTDIREQRYFAVCARGDLAELKASSALVDIWDDNGNAPLHVATLNGHDQCVAFLLGAKADAHAKTNKGDTALNLASALGWACIAELLIAAQAKVDTRNNHLQDTPLHSAVRANQRGIVALLLKAKAPLNERNADLNTPLLLAVRDRNVQLCNDLIAAGSDLEAKTTGGRSALQLMLMRQREADVAMSESDWSMAAFMVTRGADPNAQDLDGDTILHHAVSARVDASRTVHFILDANASVHVPNRWGKTPLHVAVSAQTASPLLERGARVDAVDREANTPLNCFAARGSGELVHRLLLSANAAATVEHVNMDVRLFFELSMIFPLS